jgi:hypothetical protein
MRKQNETANRKRKSFESGIDSDKNILISFVDSWKSKIKDSYESLSNFGWEVGKFIVFIPNLNIVSNFSHKQT